MKSLKVFYIWETLLMEPGKWFSVHELAYKVDVSRKQIFTVLVPLPTPPFEKDYDPRKGSLSSLRFNGSKEDADKLLLALRKDRFGLTDEFVAKLEEVLPIAGWMPASDICVEMMPYSRMSVCKALEILPNIERSVDSKGIRIYRRRK